MSSKETGILTWHIEEIAKALKISEQDVREYFTDGRRVSFIIERRIAKELFNGKTAPSEGAEYDIQDKNGGRWEVRSISEDGIYFCPSYMVGSGRVFNEKGFLDKLKAIEGYIISDIVSFPNIPFWIVSKEQVKTWWVNQQLGTTTKISRNKALELLKKM